MLERCSNTLMLDIVKTFYPNVDGLAKMTVQLNSNGDPIFAKKLCTLSVSFLSFSLSLIYKKTFSLTKLEGIGVYILNKLISKIFLSNVGSKFFDISVYYYPLCESILT